LYTKKIVDKYRLMVVMMMMMMMMMMIMIMMTRTTRIVGDTKRMTQVAIPYLRHAPPPLGSRGSRGRRGVGQKLVLCESDHVRVVSKIVRREGDTPLTGTSFTIYHHHV
jgi:hypothetical protein